MAELADAPGLGPGEATRGGSNPFARTTLSALEPRGSRAGIASSIKRRDSNPELLRDF